MKILYVIPNLSGGGAEKQLSYLAPSLRAHGHQVHLAYVHDGPEPEMIRFYLEREVILHKIRTRSNYDPRIPMQLLWLVAKERFDLIQTCICMADVVGGAIACLMHIPWVVREANSHLAWSNGASGSFSGMRRSLARQAAVIVANSEEGRKYWAESYRDKRCEVIHNAFDFEYIRANAEEYRTDRERPFFLYVGRLHPQKNVDRLIEAFVNLEVSEADLIIVGDGRQRSELDRLVDKRDPKTAHVRLLGRLPPGQVWALMRNALALTLVSEYEGFPNVTGEAASLGCPLLLSEIPSHRSIWGTNAALFVDHRSPEAIGTALRRLLHDSDLRHKFAENAAIVVQRFSVESMVDQYLRVYTTLVCGLPSQRQSKYMNSGP